MFTSISKNESLLTATRFTMEQIGVATGLLSAFRAKFIRLFVCAQEDDGGQWSFRSVGASFKERWNLELVG